ncbi:LacI family DNA-binding transcriptional regulator [Sphingobacterium paludis]|uniref:LacI family transcriptional regulator n=1 Tax=Sphingobacterium paludis TaxID=1476465 RepID=A0A4R7CSZ5_9SPHI|nr:LacI family DNA-binding transcriptional regulator [Sphingobacterium paludis]TDS11147.1 LacI family transcriptional regulator [Sphingobacterium paludis]
MANNITIVELAAALGLSKSTVSRAFRDSEDINPKTREKILQKASELGFSPNLYASNLRGNKSHTIAIIIPEFGNKFFSQAIKGIEWVARNNGYHVLIYVTDHSAEKEAEIIRTLMNGRVDGVIMSGSGEGNNHEYLTLLQNHKVPLVFFDRYYEDVDTACITGNDFESSYQATNHLITNGARRIAYLAVNKDVSIGKIRMEGYKKALKEANIPINDQFILDTSNVVDVNYADIKKLIEDHRPDAIFASVERLAMSTIRVAKELQLDIPRDLKLICFSCLDIADMLQPSLSVVKQPAYEMGIAATKKLFDILCGRKPEGVREIVFLNSELIFQKSSSKS